MLHRTSSMTLVVRFARLTLTRRNYGSHVEPFSGAGTASTSKHHLFVLTDRDPKDFASRVESDSSDPQLSAFMTRATFELAPLGVQVTACQESPILLRHKREKSSGEAGMREKASFGLILLPEGLEARQLHDEQKSNSSGATRDGTSGSTTDEFEVLVQLRAALEEINKEVTPSSLSSSSAIPLPVSDSGRSKQELALATIRRSHFFSEIMRHRYPLLRHFRATNDRFIFVCTHARRDARCGEKGAAVASQIEQMLSAQSETLSSVRLLRTSHLGGHKFAGVVLDYESATSSTSPSTSASNPFPKGCDWYSLQSTADVNQFMNTCICQNQVWPDRWRGRLGLTKEEQQGLITKALFRL